ncbi:MAG: PD40 domain-containing protein, partial [Bacteroidaceae bacterium]|nr:PD40 domain-containing protein [Bacteroidaceae bacterium]
MKLNFLIMASFAAIATLASCSNQGEKEVIIGKPDIKVENGKFTPEVLKAMAKVNGAQVSPDGSKILFGVKYESIELNKGNNELWIMDIDGSNQQKITETASSEGNAAWLSDSKRIAFTYPVDGKPQLFVMNADGSNRKQLSNIEKGLEGFLISPDETKIAVISTVKYGQRTNDMYPELDKASGKIVDDLMYKHWDEWVTEIPHTFVADIDFNSGIGELKDILEGEPYEAPMRPFGGSESLAWTADSKSIIYVSRKKTGLEYSVSTNSDLYEYNLESGNTRNLT